MDSWGRRSRCRVAVVPDARRPHWGALWEVTGPLRRPIWRVFVAASWPWPLVLMLGIGATAVASGLVILSDLSRERPLGLWLLLGGAAIMLVSPFLWRDARRERAGYRWR